MDGKSDVYSLGAVLYQMLAGRPPFSAAGAGELISLHLTAEPPSLAAQAPHAPPAITGLVHRLLQKDRELRPSMAQAALELEELAAGQGAAGRRAPLTLPALEPRRPGAELKELLAGVLEPEPESESRSGSLSESASESATPIGSLRAAATVGPSGRTPSAVTEGLLAPPRQPGAGERSTGTERPASTGERATSAPSGRRLRLIALSLLVWAAVGTVAWRLRSPLPPAPRELSVSAARAAPALPAVPPPPERPAAIQAPPALAPEKKRALAPVPAAGLRRQPPRAAKPALLPDPRPSEPAAEPVFKVLD